MKTILLRNVLDHSRFVGRRGWTRFRRRARSFASVHAAILFCVDHDIRDIEVIVHFGDANAADVIVTVESELAPPSTAAESWLDADHRLAYV